MISAWRWRAAGVIAGDRSALGPPMRALALAGSLLGQRYGGWRYRIRQHTLDSLSGWALPPPAAREAGDTAPIRCFDTQPPARAA